MNVKAIHNFLNIVSVLVGALLAFDFAGVGSAVGADSGVAGTILGGLGFVQTMISAAKNGIGGLFSADPAA